MGAYQGIEGGQVEELSCDGFVERSLERATR
jgi:hypothetical protein